MVERHVRPVGDEERYELIRNHLTTVSEIVATFEAAFEDDIPIDKDRSLVMLRECLKEINRAYNHASASTYHEIDALGIGEQHQVYTRDLTDDR